MKRMLFIAGVILLAFSSFSQDRYNYDKKWKEVDSLEKKKLPRSALELVDEIHARARSEKNTPQYIRSVIYRAKLKGDFAEEHLAANIEEVKEELGKADEPARQLLHSILAELYWMYYQSNRYQLLERSRTAGDAGDDIRTWDLSALIDEVIRHYQASLDNKDLLKKSAIGKFEPILIKEEEGRTYRPTLYDFLAHRAADFLMSEESGITRPADRFELEGEKYFLPAEQFADTEITTHDTLSLKFHAITILRDLIRFHLDDKEPAALIDADLKRLEFVRRESVEPAADSLYLSTLQQMEEEHAGNLAVADVLFAIATYYVDKGLRYDPFSAPEFRWDLSEAKKYCDKAIEKYPGTDGAQNCKTLLPRITEVTLNLNIHEAEIPGKEFPALLTFRNTGKAFFRVIRLSHEEDRLLRQKHHGEALVRQYSQKPFIRSWNVTLPDEGDYQPHAAQIAIPALDAGYYVILASPDGTFSGKETPVAHASFWITGIAIASSNAIDGTLELYMLHRETGGPLKGAVAKAFQREYDRRSRTYSDTLVGEYTSDKNGYISIPGVEQSSRSFYLVFQWQGQDYATSDYFYNRSFETTRKPSERTFFFTDRSIYRPGQTLYFKGIVLEDDGKEKKILKKHPLKVEFYDVNNQKISSLDLTTNEYGSVEGTFTAPQNALTGRMRISSPSGSLYVSVEEYKRPRFEAFFEPVKGSYKLNQEVKIEGKAMAYAGNPVDGASVDFRVTRTVHYPFRDFPWYWPIPVTPETEILNGTATTDENGNFEVVFRALEDRNLKNAAVPLFNFRITADVTDINGETHTAVQNISVSEKSLLIDLDIGEKIAKKALDSLKVTVRNLNGELVETEGKITLHLLEGPGRLLRSRDWKRPDIFLMEKEEFIGKFPRDIYDNEDEPSSWEKTTQTFSREFTSGSGPAMQLSDPGSWKDGMYLATVEVTDPFGEEITKEFFFTLYSEDASKPPLNAYKWLVSDNDPVEPGGRATFLAGTAARDIRLLYELRKDRQVLQRSWLELDREQEKIVIPVSEEHRGNLSVHLLFIKDNRNYEENALIQVPHSDKKLDLTISSFRDKLQPGSAEEWSLTIRGDQGEAVVAELLASMYDASLDALQPHSWSFDILRYYYGGNFWNSGRGFNLTSSNLVRPVPAERVTPSYRGYDHLNWFGYSPRGAYRHMDFMSVTGMATKNLGQPEMAEGTQEMEITDQEVEENLAATQQQPEKEEPGMEGVPVRRNLEETAFFFPKIYTNEDGEVKISFTLPESLTRWKFMALAHTPDLKYGMLEKTVVAQKDLMVVPNPPRFLRESDTIFFPVKIVSLSEEELKVRAQLEFFNARTMEPVNDLLQVEHREQEITVKSGKSGSLEWKAVVPEGMEALVYRVKAVAGNFSDGEESMLPVLPNRILVTETKTLPVKGAGTHEFRFEELLQSASSSTLDPYRLTLEYTSNPAWYAVQALPYLMEYPYECSEQVFSRYYSNALASYIANSNPKIRAVFDQWRALSPDAFLSNLEKNEELKNILLEESPWLMQAKNETEQKKRIALLFDLNRIKNEQQASIQKLLQLQLPGGAWPWFKGMRENRYITQHIVTGIAKLDRLEVIEIQDGGQVTAMIRRALQYLDEEIANDLKKIKEDHPKYTTEDHLSNLHIQYLYARSFLGDVLPVREEAREANNYFLSQAEKYWTDRGQYLQGMIALVMHRTDKPEVAMDIVKSLKEHALHSEEMGIYWREEGGYLWHRAPVERQALMIGLFDEVAGDKETVEDLKVWLLKQKQTQHWKTTKATTDAIYALLLRGTDLLASDEIVQVTLGHEKIDPLRLEGTGVEAGTGYYKVHWDGNEVDPSMGNITVVKKDEGIAWGGLYFQYYENLDKISESGSPLEISKELFVEKNTAEGPVIVPIATGTPVKAGDKIVVRLTIRSDRDMEYVHLKDLRAAGTEPVNVLSGYRYQGGLGYYESTRDASTNFFMDYLRKGTYVLEYELKVYQAGNFSSGIATLQSMYAPEFAAHSAGGRIDVRR